MQIVADTSTFYTPAQGKELGVTIIPVCVVMNGTSYKDLEEISSEDFLKFISEGGVPTSSQPSIGEILEVLESTTEDTIVITVGDGLSGAYQNAMGAKNSIEDNEHIYVLDSKTLGAPHRYLVQKAVRLREMGLPTAEIIKQLQESIESSVSFVIPADFEFLKRSGRLTPIAAKISALIKIVPVLTQTQDKKRIEPLAIKRSEKKALQAILDRLREIGVDENYIISAAHAGTPQKAEAAVKMIREQFPDSTTESYMLSPALITHGGPGCIVIQAVRK